MSVSIITQQPNQALVFCLSGDAKPNGADGWFLLEVDTGKVYWWTAGAWVCSSNLSYPVLSSGIISAETLGSGSPDATKYLRGDRSWQTVTAAPPDLTRSMLSPAQSQTVETNYAALANSSYEITGSLNLTINGNAKFCVA